MRRLIQKFWNKCHFWELVLKRPWGSSTQSNQSDALANHILILSFRMYPVVIGNGRNLQSDAVIGGYNVPKGVR